MKDLKKIVNFIFEINNLKRFEHCGTKFAGVKHPDSIAEHVFRTMQIAYIMAKLENVSDSELLQILEISLFHDNAEVRINDIHRIASRYLDSHEAEDKAFQDQINGLPEVVRGRLQNIIRNYNATEKNLVYLIARDADLLETMFQAKEYADMGYKTERWLKNGRQLLKTKSAIKIFDVLRKTGFTDWWDELNKI